MAAARGADRSGMFFAVFPSSIRQFIERGCSMTAADVTERMREGQPLHAIENDADVFEAVQLQAASRICIAREAAKLDGKRPFATWAFARCGWFRRFLGG